MIVVLDTSAIVEILKGSEAGREAVEELSKAQLVIVPSIVIAELTSFLQRNGFPTVYVDRILEQGLVADLDEHIAKLAGERHAKLKKIEKGICIVMVTAEEYGAKVITKDRHFELYEGQKRIIGSA